MAILEFQQPDRVIMLESDTHHGLFEFRPLEPTYGTTIGHALRRVLLSSLEGFAISWIKIDGVDHEFSTIPGVVEDVTQIVLNLKKVRFGVTDPSYSGGVVMVSISGQTEFSAGLINNFLTGVQVLNPDLVLCHMESDVRLDMQIHIQKGRGYVPADENFQGKPSFGVIPLDGIYTPIRNASWKVENYRVEQKTDYEKLILEIETDGSISPKDALKEAASILLQHFCLFSDEKMSIPVLDVTAEEEMTEEQVRLQDLLSTPLTEMGLSVRALNCLKSAEVYTLGDLASYSKSELLKFRNFGRKSLSELEDLLTEHNLTFAEDIEKQ
ncbi:MAG: DNA-directed RNA polymerase subunit alpha [Bacteroides sp.]